MNLHSPSAPESLETPRRILVGGVIAEKKNNEWRVLMVHNQKEGYIRVEPTGGKVKVDVQQNPIETLEEATHREAMEEVQLAIIIKRHLGSFPTSSLEGAFDVETFLCRKREEEDVPEIPPEEAHKLAACQWYTIDELRNEPRLVPNMQAALDAIEAALQEEKD